MIGRSLKILVLLGSLMVPFVMAGPSQILAQESGEEGAPNKLNEVKNYLKKVDALLKDLKSKPAEQLNSKTDAGVRPADVILELQSARDQIDRQLKKFNLVGKGDSQWGEQGAWLELEAAMPLLEQRYEKAQNL